MPDPVSSPSAAPEVFLLVGQSNMAGRGRVEDEDRRPVPGVLVLDRNGAWAGQGEPIHFDKESAGVGPGFTFGGRVARHLPGVAVGLVPCAVGGTPIARWLPGADLYQAAVARARVALRDGRLRGILWHQGETDALEEGSARAYAGNLVAVVEGLRRDLDAPRVPFVVGELGRFLLHENVPGHPAPHARVVNEQIHRLPALVPETAVVSSEGLNHLGDGLHFDRAAQRIMGARYFEAWRALAGV